VTTNGCRFNTIHIGSGGHDVVCIHGLLLDNLSSFYYTLAPAIAQHADVYLYDLRGHGRSERPDSGYGIQDSVADLLGLLDHFGLTEPVHLVGNSYGGFIALRMAIDHPDRVSGLLLIEAHYPVAGFGDQMVEGLTLLASEARASSDLATREGRPDKKAERFAQHADALVHGTTLLDDIRNIQPLSDEELNSVRCPVQAFYGTDSPLADRGPKLERLVPDCELHMIPEASHFALLETTTFIGEHFVEALGSGTEAP